MHRPLHVLGALKFNPTKAEAATEAATEAAIPSPSTTWFCMFLERFRRCQPVALAFLHLSLGRQKATSGSFSTDGFGWLGLNPAGVSLFRMHRPLHVLGALKFNPTKAEAATEAAIPSPSTTWFCMFLEQFPEGAFSMASYRILRRSKGTLGLCRAVCLWLVGLESCWGFPVSHASSTPCSRGP